MRKSKKTQAAEYAADGIKNLKQLGAYPFDELKTLSDFHKLDCCAGSYTAWDVLKLMLMLEYTLTKRGEL